jgi:hypothetical protein
VYCTKSSRGVGEKAHGRRYLVFQAMVDLLPRNSEYERFLKHNWVYLPRLKTLELG